MIEANVLSQKQLGRLVYDHLLTPSSPFAIAKKSSPADYGHFYRYEYLFCGDGSDLLAIEKAGRDRAGLVVDLGCGTGRLAIRLARQGREVIGVDLSRSMLGAAEEAKKRLPEDVKRRVDFICADMVSWESPREISEVFCLNNALSHVATMEGISSALRNTLRRLEAGGQLVFDVHHSVYWMASRSWLANRWSFVNKIASGNENSWVWRRTSGGNNFNQVVFEHAVSPDRFHFVELRSAVFVLPVDVWVNLLYEVGFSDVECWGGWMGEVLRPSSEMVVFRATK